MAEALNTSQNMILLNNINKLLRENKTFGATNLNLPYDNPNLDYPNGTAAVSFDLFICFYYTLMLINCT